MKKTLLAFLSKNQYDGILLTVYLLNLSDYLFTLILISSGLFMEANPLLSMNIDGIGGFVLKCLVPLLLLMYLHIRFTMSPPKHEKTVRLLLNLILSYYAVINAFHVFWLSYYIVIFR